MVRRRLAPLILLATVLHIVGIARTPLPAQDGLKFIRIAKDFQKQPWDSVVRGSDQHPLYPALIALSQPLWAAILGPSPHTWRIAAQAVSASATVLALVPIFGVARELFGRRVATLSGLAWVLLPQPATVGRDTLSDPLALLFATLSLRFGIAALRGPTWRSALVCGLAGGLGYLTRPEVALIPLVVLATAGLRALPTRLRAHAWRPENPFRVETARFAILGMSFLAIVGSYAIVKGELSEKLAMRRAVALSSPHDQERRVGHPLPAGLDNPRLNFAPKEENNQPARLGPLDASIAVLRGWAEGLGWCLAPFVALGLWRGAPSREPGRTLLALFALAFAAVLIRHGMTLGYVSSRHTLMLVLISLPWAASGLLAAGRRFAIWLGLGPDRQRAAVLLVGTCALLLGSTLQLKASHPSRWGHQAAGQWLLEHAEAGDAVLDTRGWSAFLSNLRAYGPWHIKQALTDSRLAFVVIGRDELEADSPRAATLRALLDRAGERIAAFPAREAGAGLDVLVYRYRRPESWEGLVP